MLVLNCLAKGLPNTFGDELFKNRVVWALDAANVSRMFSHPACFSLLYIAWLNGWRH